MASTLTLLVIALVVSVQVQGTLAHYPPSPLDFLKNLNGTRKGDKGEGLGQLKKHLANLGYIDPTINPAHDDTFDDTLHQAIIKYQDFFKIKATGTLDSQTVASMLQPRCGVADIRFNHNATFGDIKFTFLKSKWPVNKRHLTVSFREHTRRDAYYPVLKALGRWTDVSHFKFQFIFDFSASDVKMSFESREHGDGHKFDGPEGVLAHSTPPDHLNKAYLHFDADESWETYKKMGKYNLQTVALHELGHVLGLGHSQNKDAIMFPSIGPHEKKDLNIDDIDGIKALYRRS